MAVNLSPLGGVGAQFFDSNGNPLSGGLIYTYAAGTNTPQATYTSSSGFIQHSNPIVLDAAGRVPTGEIWLTDGVSYKFVIQTSAAVLVGTYDNIVGINSNFVAYTLQQEIQTATAGQTVFNLTTMQYQPGTHSLSVYVDGVNQYGPGAQYAYIETSSTAVTFVSGLHDGASVKFTTAISVASNYANADAVEYDPPFTDATPTNVADKLAETISVKDYGAVGNGAVDDTAAIQSALDNNQQATIYVPDGTYEITGIKVYPYQQLVFSSDAIFKMSASGIAIRTSSITSQTAPTGVITRVILDNPRIDMNNFAGFGILLECCTNAQVNNPYVANVANATFNYADGYDTGTVTWNSTGIVLKGITNTYGCYYNQIQHAKVTCTSKGSNTGIWLGSSHSGTTQRANFNQINQAVVYGLATGIEVALGGDNRIVQPELSICNTGIAVGDSGLYAYNSRRTFIVQPYMETCSTVGIKIGAYADDTVIDGVAATGSTTSIIDDNGTTTSIFAANTDSVQPLGYTRFYGDSVRFTNTPSNWKASTAYVGGTTGDNVIPIPNNGIWYHCIQAGTSGTTQPTWPTIIGNSVTDGTTKWEARGYTPDDTDPNSLDWYSEGTYTVQVYDANTGGNVSSTQATGYYTRVGNIVTLNIPDINNIDTTGLTAGNDLYISVPFDPLHRASGSVILNQFAYGAGTSLSSYIGSADTRARIAISTSGSAHSYVTVSMITSGVSDVYNFNLVYHASK